MLRSPTVSAGVPARSVPCIRISCALFWMAVTCRSPRNCRCVNVAPPVRRATPRGATLAGMERLAFEFDPRYAFSLGLLGVRPSTAEVRVTDDGRLEVDFGPWRVRTALTNVTGAQVTGPYRAFRAIGPHVSLADRGVSFG